jgi:hypothetical protein
MHHAPTNLRPSLDQRTIAHRQRPSRKYHPDTLFHRAA